jgi:hypothetical protein
MRTKGFQTEHSRVRVLKSHWTNTRGQVTALFTNTSTGPCAKYLVERLLHALSQAGHTGS